MINRRCIVACAAACLVAIVAGASFERIVERPHLSREDASELRRFHNFCGVTRAAMLVDAIDFESGDPKRQLEAADRFYTFVTNHSIKEINMCSPVPPDLRARDSCWLRDDYDCLARLARLAMTSIPVYPIEDDR